MNPDSDEEKQKQTQQLWVFMGMPATMAACVFVGWAIGSWLDKRFHGGGMLVALFVFLGMASGFYEVFQMLKNFNK